MDSLIYAPHFVPSCLFHYLDLEVSEFRKRINGKPIHAWSGLFVTPDDEYLKIDDNDESNPDNSDPPKEPFNNNKSDGEKKENENKNPVDPPINDNETNKNVRNI